MTAIDKALASAKIEKIIDLLKTAGGFLIDAQIVENRSQPSPENPAISINLSGQDVSFFVRNNGELTDAVHQVVVAMLHLSPGDEDLVWFDVNHLRADRREQLRRLAEDAIAHVRSTEALFVLSHVVLRATDASSGSCLLRPQICQRRSRWRALRRPLSGRNLATCRADPLWNSTWFNPPGEYRRLTLTHIAAQSGLWDPGRTN